VFSLIQGKSNLFFSLCGMLHHKNHGKSEIRGKWKIHKYNARNPMFYLISGILLPFLRLSAKKNCTLKDAALRRRSPTNISE